MTDSTARLRSLPKAGPPNDDVSKIRGNCTDEVKQLNVNILAYYAGVGASSVFGSEQAKQLRLVEANLSYPRTGGPITDNPSSLQAEAIYEIEVQEGMLNRVGGTMAGACMMHLLDVCTFGTLYVLGAAVNRDMGGLSLSMDIKYHEVASPGMVLSIVATSVSTRGRLLYSRGEVYERKTGKLIASALHTIKQFRSRGETTEKAAPKL
ncbi:hypothetical protein PHLGIDRAFT_11320 [Phlebiopsis gigantea 11061_1 CR5-6]|uniref:Thioesterase domain-containing protein n=1 Tax=Phlebiopsis gigantea (strain 11061_1 CR5-6) TaxID=745531 RepID=A0A0C3SBW0_PHLG1|nr:hypothetical protein PHLGIDRAFT_11320 [Phlebiopsis gigantea 11061_1 CR5-6]